MQKRGYEFEKTGKIGLIAAGTADLPVAEEARVVADMEGALPSVVASLVNVPVIGVPTSVGYGRGGKGVAAPLSMLQSCSPGF